MNESRAPLIEATLALVAIFEELGIPNLVGGSLASSAYGEVRTTQDADLVIDLAADRVGPLVERLRPGFYADEERARSAVERTASFNVIHLATMSKVDLFVAGDDPANRRQFERARRLSLPGSTEKLTVVSPEDVIVQKLRWYRLGNEVSDRQWRDAVGVVRLQADRLDREYLRRAAGELEVGDLLERLLGD